MTDLSDLRVARGNLLLLLVVGLYVAKISSQERMTCC